MFYAIDEYSGFPACDKLGNATHPFRTSSDSTRKFSENAGCPMNTNIYDNQWHSFALSTMPASGGWK